ncbi:MAG: replisome organizer [Lachnospiraceae bacterium]|nr:replisome organizer [Lachnospiraceae bacterium]
MANKRMFNNMVLDTDAFLDMPLSAQALYFHLNMRADDDGFISNPKRIQAYIGASEDDLRLLVLKNFVIAFEDGVIVIKHWRMHNTIQKDRYHPTNYKEDLALLGIKENKAYTLDVSKMETGCIQNVSSDLGLGLDKDLDIGKDLDLGLDKEKEAPVQKELKHKYGEYNHVLLTDSDRERLVNDYGEDSVHDAIKYLDEYIETSGKKYKNHYLVMRKWVFDAIKERKGKTQTLWDEWKDA